jgi:predicted O-linked N-acetylglucosamine transferase (SPINDLY family)
MSFDANTVWQRAQAHFNKGLYKRALDEAQALARHFPQADGAQHMIGASLLMLGDPVAAKPYVETALALNPGNGGYLNTAGSIEARLGNNTPAMALFREAIAADGMCIPAFTNLGRLFEAEGRQGEALATWMRAFAADVNNPQVLTALLHGLQAGGHESALVALRQAVDQVARGVSIDIAAALAQARQPDAVVHALLDPLLVALAEYALALHTAKRREEAKHRLLLGVVIAPGHGDAWATFGVALAESDAALAVQCRQLAVDRTAAGHGSLRTAADALRALGRGTEAMAFVRAHFDSRIRNADNLTALAAEHAACSEWPASEALAREALSLDPAWQAANAQLGAALLAQGQPTEGIPYLEKATRLRPSDAFAWHNLGAAKAVTGKSHEAMACLGRAVELLPDQLMFRRSLASVLLSNGRIDDGLVHLAKARQMDPDATDLLALTMAYSLERKPADARHAAKRLAEMDPDALEPKANQIWVEFLTGSMPISLARPRLLEILDESPRAHYWRARLATSVDAMMPATMEPVLEHRAWMLNELNRLADNPSDLGDIQGSNFSAMFYLAYHGLNNREINMAAARMYRRNAPQLNFSAAHLARKRRGGRIRLGLLSNHFFNHTIGRLNRGLFHQLDRKRFELFMFYPESGPRDEFATEFSSLAEHAIALPSIAFERIREKVAEAELDILHYTDIGMEAFTYFTAFSRLARVQTVTWGHPDTTGLDTIDYFLSNEWVDVPDCQDHYTETPILLPGLHTHYYRPPIVPGTSRASLGLPEHMPLLVCAQTMFKFHPEFDSIVHRLLSRNPTARLAVIDAGTLFKNAWLERMRRLDPKILSQIIVMPRMASTNFMAFMGLADVVLDTPVFSGGNTSLEAFSIGIPVVTFPSPFLRGRFTAAFYKFMGFTELIASDVEHYIALTERLIRDQEFNFRCRRQIHQLSVALYENPAVVPTLTDFFATAVDAAEAGRKMSAWEAPRRGAAP